MVVVVLRLFPFVIYLVLFSLSSIRLIALGNFVLLESIGLLVFLFFKSNSDWVLSDSSV